MKMPVGICHNIKNAWNFRKCRHVPTFTYLLPPFWRDMCFSWRTYFAWKNYCYSKSSYYIWKMCKIWKVKDVRIWLKDEFLNGKEACLTPSMALSAHKKCSVEKFDLEGFFGPSPLKYKVLSKLYWRILFMNVKSLRKNAKYSHA